MIKLETFIFLIGAIMFLLGYLSLGLFCILVLNLVLVFYTIGEEKNNPPSKETHS